MEVVAVAGSREGQGASAAPLTPLPSRSSSGPQSVPAKRSANWGDSLVGFEPPPPLRWHLGKSTASPTELASVIAGGGVGVIAGGGVGVTAWEALRPRQFPLAPLRRLLTAPVKKDQLPSHPRWPGRP
jgi:hypothetical protein